MLNKRPYQICTRCIMDTSDPFIEFDSKGVCNHCKSFDEQRRQLPLSREDKQRKLEQTVDAIKKAGKGKAYDCISGVSGGVDSTYITYKLKDFGLRPLVVHLDNGWNSELAVMNIENLIHKTGFDLYTRVLNWEEFRRLQVAYLKSSVLDLEALSDHAIYATIFTQAIKHRVEYIVSGGNVATEGILPESWRYDRKLTDVVNIKAIFKQFDGGKLKDFPLMSIQKFAWYYKIRKIKLVSLLDFMDYVKEDAKEIIIRELGWRDYGGKHYESIITRFYQGYILPTKFGIDKRRAHYATLVAAGQMSREMALEKMKEPIMPADILKQDLEYVPKKLGLTKEEFDKIMALPPKSHDDYPTDKNIRQFFVDMNRRFKKNQTSQ